MNQFINNPVVNWSAQYIPQPIEVRVKEHKILIGVCFAILGLIFGGIALVAYINAISTLAKNGWSQQVGASLMGGTFMLVVLVAVVGGLLLLGYLTRRSFVKYMSASGVQTRSGRTYNWSDLHYLDYRKVRNTGVSLGGAGIAGRVVSRAATNAAQAAIYAGQEKVMVRLVFANGKAVVPPLVKNQQEILGLLGSMPVQRREDGKVIQ